VVDLAVDREVAWAAPQGPEFLFRCAACESTVRIALSFHLERGSDPRPLRLFGGGTELVARPCILLVDQCPHGCGAKLGLQLEPGDPALCGTAWPDTPLALGGYRCPRCDGEGVLRLEVQIRE
jgi:hypothetical protein